MLAIKKLVDVVQEVQAEKACKRQSRHHQKSKTGVSVVQQKRHLSSKIFNKKGLNPRTSAQFTTAFTGDI